MLKPVKRSKFRIFLGKKYFTLKRYYNWKMSNVSFAKKSEEKLFPHIVFTHKTPLYRKLKNVDMWMQYNKVINLKIALKKINKVIIKPGEVFSYWKLIGRPKKKDGYVEGMILHYGKFKSGIGGGLCQLSNLIYWITLHSPLTVIERHRHSYDVFPDSKRTQPFGSGATCYYNYIDLQIKNNTDQDFQLDLKLSDEYLIGHWRSNQKPLTKFKIYEKDHWITQEYWGGYIRHNTIYRKVLNNNNEVIEDEYITENHGIMMYQPLLENGELKGGI